MVHCQEVVKGMPVRIARLPTVLFSHAWETVVHIEAKGTECIKGRGHATEVNVPHQLSKGASLHLSSTS